MRFNFSILVGFTLIYFVQTPAINATVLSFPYECASQTGVGGIEGKLMGNMEAVSGAELVLMQKDKIFAKTTTDENGNYHFYYFNPGRYDIKASKEGYRTSIIINIPVYQDNTTLNNFYLPKHNDRKMPSGPIIDDYEYNRKKYMRQR